MTTTNRSPHGLWIGYVFFSFNFQVQKYLTRGSDARNKHKHGVDVAIKLDGLISYCLRFEQLNG